MVIQRGFLYDIKNETSKAKESYALGIKKYRELLNQKDLNNDFNLRIEHISALEANENLNLVKSEIEKLKKDFSKNEIVQIYAKEYKPKSKSELISLWKNGESDIHDSTAYNSRSCTAPPKTKLSKSLYKTTPF